jgi:hypothetical protein
MKKIIFLFVLAIVSLTVAQNGYAQNYKQPVPSIDAKGKITDAKGKHIGWITSEGIIKDATGVKI